MFFRNKTVKGYACYEPYIKIYDSQGKNFYSFPNTKGIIKFNLPKGNFFTDNYLYPLSVPVKYNLPKLAKPERYLSPKNIKVHVAKNPHRCSIFPELGDIIADPEICKMPVPYIIYILFHEMGHHYYKTESKCDTFAAYHMLKRGFNPSQINFANLHTLSNSPKVFSRKENSTKILSYA